jgi:hypothetical protein
LVFGRKKLKPRFESRLAVKLGSSGRSSVARPHPKLPRSRKPNKSVIRDKSAAWSKSRHWILIFEAPTYF